MVHCTYTVHSRTLWAQGQCIDWFCLGSDGCFGANGLESSKRSVAEWQKCTLPRRMLSEDGLGPSTPAAFLTTLYCDTTARAWNSSAFDLRCRRCRDRYRPAHCLHLLCLHTPVQLSFVTRPASASSRASRSELSRRCSQMGHEGGD